MPNKKTDTTGKKPRVRSQPKHRSFKLTNKKYRQPESIPVPWKIFKDTLRLILQNKILFGGIAIINAIISFAFVQGFGSSFELSSVKTDIENLFNGQVSQISIGAALFGYLVGTAGVSASESSGVYQLFFTLFTSLAIIWTTRQLLAQEKPRIRDGYYRGLYPLIPFLLVIILIGIQLVPLIAGNLIFTTVINNGLAVTILEKVLWLLLFIVLGMLSLYMLTSSLFGLYIVTLPDMTPLKALRSARELVLHRRVAIAIRLLALPILLAIITVAIFMPLVFVAPLAAQYLFLLATSFALVIVHVYMYLLYRSLL